jgi:hypothetical protein
MLQALRRRRLNCWLGRERGNRGGVTSGGGERRQTWNFPYDSGGSSPCWKTGASQLAVKDGNTHQQQYYNNKTRQQLHQFDTPSNAYRRRKSSAAPHQTDLGASARLLLLAQLGRDLLLHRPAQGAHPERLPRPRGGGDALARLRGAVQPRTLL